MSKDADFVQLLERYGPPPRILWITCGNSSNARLKQLFEKTWEAAAALFNGGEPLVEIKEESD